MVGNDRHEVETVMRIIIAVLVVSLAACASAPLSESALKIVPEVFESSSFTDDDIDSLAVHGERVYVTAKTGDRLIVVDANNGSTVSSSGRAGSSLGELQRPNGIAVIGDLAIVVERDNHRLQMYALPALQPLAVGGEDVLRRPYGIAVYESAPGVIQAYVTDNHDAGSPDDLAQRVRQFEIRRDGDRVSTTLVRSFGDRSGDGALQKVETIAVDPENGQLLVVDETAQRMGIRVYGLDGRFTGRVAGRDWFRTEPEGIVSIGSFWIVTDQHPQRTRFHILDRKTLAHRGAFIGNVTGNTDGITASDRRLYAVHDDHSVTAFDWSAIAAALGLTEPGVTRE